MAGDWIKMRGALFQSPKLITAARLLNDSQPFREWLTPGGSGSMNGQIVSDDALRCVTCALLLRVWSAAREFGKFNGDDLFLPHISVVDLDTMAGAPGIGAVMEAVGWAVNGEGVTLPNFKQHNVPMSNAEKQREYRNRHNHMVTAALPERGNKSVTREEKRREEKRVKNKSAHFTPPTIEEVKAYCLERGNAVNPEKWHAHYTANGWKVGRNTMKDWRAAVRTWEGTDFGNSKPAKPTIDDYNAKMAAKYGSEAKAGAT